MSTAIGNLEMPDRHRRGIKRRRHRASGVSIEALKEQLTAVEGASLACEITDT